MKNNGLRAAISLAFCLLLILPSLDGHEFWLGLTRYRLAPGGETVLTFFVGEDFHGETWTKRNERLQSLKLYGADGVKDLSATAMETDTLPMSLSFANAGTHLLAMESKNSYIELDGEKFTAYLEEDGIDNIKALRSSKGESTKAAREHYRRCAKTILQVGSKTDHTPLQKLGQALEIVPLKNPYALRKGEELTLQVMFLGKPLPNTVVRTWQKAPAQETAKARLRTDAEGKTSFIPAVAGEWMVSLVYMIPSTDPAADYQSYWATLVFQKE
jgi:uncharacterized GH25 family protein